MARSGPPRASPPTLTSRAIFRCKVLVLRALRGMANLRSGPGRHAHGKPEAAARVLESRTPLRTPCEPAEVRLQLGKIQNLRLATARIHGIHLRAGSTFSFWAEIGRATRWRGFVHGREIREGCLVPSVGGGLCQLSNALYDLALRSGCEVLERHPHTMPVPGSTAQDGRDATVAWNHIDLRFRPSRDLWIEAWLTQEDLVVRFLGDAVAELPMPAKPKNLKVINPPVGACETCGKADCGLHHHPESISARSGGERKGYLLDAVWPEWQSLVDDRAPGDQIFVPLDGARLRVDRYAWGHSDQRATAAAVKRMVAVRRAKCPPQIRATQLTGADEIARAYARKLPFDATELVVDIGLLPELWRTGALGGRSYEVWLSRFPLKIAHELLDSAALKLAGAKLLSDFRADSELVEREWSALQRASKVVTPHPWLANQLKARLGVSVQTVDWIVSERAESVGAHIFFPGPTAAREGAHVVREAMKKLGLPLAVGGRNLEEPGFWDGISTTQGTFETASVIVCPAVFKNRPQAAIAAARAGIPVIATPQCGIPGAIEVEFGDVGGLTEAIRLVHAR